MRRTLRFSAAACAVVALLALAATVTAQSKLPKLPQPYVFAQTGDSPGKVTFNHESHVDESAPSCTSCHPKAFQILKKGATVDGRPITHAAMEKGQACGMCHNGKTSFGFDDCTMCHRAQ
jgi:c(7)-type cytochrome triheme protein